MSREFTLCIRERGCVVNESYTFINVHRDKLKYTMWLDRTLYHFVKNCHFRTDTVPITLKVRARTIWLTADEPETHTPETELCSDKLRRFQKTYKSSVPEFDSFVKQAHEHIGRIYDEEVQLYVWRRWYAFRYLKRDQLLPLDIIKIIVGYVE
jgi:hypothetical protein